MIDIILAILVYAWLFFGKRFLGKHGLVDLLLFSLSIVVFFNLWFYTYQGIFSRFVYEFGIFFTYLPVLGIILILYLESMRRLEEKEKIKTREFFSKYVSPKIVEELLRQKDLRVGGVKREVTVLFTDVRGFTSMSERLRPEEVFEILNGHFDIINDEIFRHDGTVLKFIGDATMAVFGAPMYQEDHAVRAIRCCIDIQKRMRDYSRRLRDEKGLDFHIGIGINTGEVVLGNLGSHKQMDYTVIGDTVNVASRLNGVAGKDEIVVSEETYLRAREEFDFEGPFEVKVKGKDKPLKVYKVVY